MNRRFTTIFAFTIIAGVGILVFFGYREPKVTISPVNFKVQSLTFWNINIPIEEIVNIDTVSWKEIPRISYRSNGISLFGVHRGWFKTKDENTVWLSVKRGVTPLIRIVEKNGKTYYMNRKNTAETMDIFDKLTGFTENKGL